MAEPIAFDTSACVRPKPVRGLYFCCIHHPDAPQDLDRQVEELLERLQESLQNKITEDSALASNGKLSSAVERKLQEVGSNSLCACWRYNEHD